MEEKLRDRAMKLADELENHTIAIRRQIHQHPELSFQEKNTSALVCKELDRIGIPYTRSPIKPGIVATIDSGKLGKYILLRADMDALPIQENTGLNFASEEKNVMHACGHDVHTANLLAVGEILNRTKDAWKGKVELVFQPAEENGGGGKKMVRNGLMDDHPDACFGIHVEDSVKGQMIITKGYSSAYSDGYQITIRGKAAHSSKPEDGVDAIYIAANVIVALHGLISRNVDPLKSSTLNIGLIKGGTAGNIIADEVQMRCMMRNLTKDVRETMIEKIKSTAEGITKALGGTCECIFGEGYAAVYNDEKFSDFVIDTINKNAKYICAGINDVNPDKIIATGEPRLGAEDFGFYAQKAPSCFVWVGTGGGSPKHSSTFQVEEKYIKMATKTMITIALDFLAS